MKTLLPLLLLILTVTTGCATHKPFGPLPMTEEDFKLPPAEMKAKFPEVAKHYAHGFQLKPNLPYTEDLTSKWGPCDKSRYDWTMPALLSYLTYDFATEDYRHDEAKIVLLTAMLGYWLFSPQTKYLIWKKGYYRITAVSLRNIVHKPHIANMRWKYTGPAKVGWFGRVHWEDYPEKTLPESQEFD